MAPRTTRKHQRVVVALIVGAASSALSFAAIDLLGLTTADQSHSLPTRICDPIDPPEVIARCLETGGQPTIF